MNNLSEFNNFNYEQGQEFRFVLGPYRRSKVVIKQRIVFTSGLKQTTNVEKLTEREIKKLSPYVRLYDCFDLSKKKNIIFSEADLAKWGKPFHSKTK